MRMLFALASLVAVPAMAASELGLDFNDHAVDVYTALPLSPLAGGAQTQLTAGYLHNDRRAHDHLNFLRAGLEVNGSFGVPGASASIGLRGFYGDREDFSGGGGALGGAVDYRFPAFNRFDVGGYLYYGPNVLVGGDFNHYLEYGVDAGYQVIRPASIYAGYRRLELPIDGSPRGRPTAAADGWHIGVKLRF